MNRGTMVPALCSFPPPCRKSYPSSWFQPFRSLAVHLCLLAVCMFLVTKPCPAQDDWFSHGGYTVDEVVRGEAGIFLVMRDGDGRFRLLTPQSEDGSVPFRVVGVGSEQVRLKEKDARVPFQLPILHRNLPLDILAYAVLSANRKNVFVTVPAGQAGVEYVPGEDYREYLSSRMESDGASVVVYSDTALAGRGGPASLPHYFTGPATTGRRRLVSLDLPRCTLGELAARLERDTGVKLSGITEPDKVLSVRCRDLSLDAILYYINGLVGCTIEPVPEKREVTRAGPAAPGPVDVTPGKTGSMSRRKARIVFRRVKRLAAAGRTKDAARLLVRLVRRYDKSPALYNALAKLFWRLGKKKKAVLCLRRSLRLDPSNSFARSRLLRIAEIRRRTGHRRTASMHDRGRRSSTTG